MTLTSGGAIGWPRAAAALRSTNLSAVVIILYLEPSKSTDAPMMAVAYPISHDFITRDFAVFIYKGGFNRSERQVVYAQRRPKRQPRRDSADGSSFGDTIHFRSYELAAN